MNVIITGRHFNVSNSLKNAIEEKLGKIRFFYDHVLQFHVFLEKEKLNYKADVTFIADGKKFYLQMKAPTISEAIDKLVDKLERQVRKHKERLQCHSREKIAHGEQGGVPSLQYIEVSNKPKAELEVLIQLANSEDESVAFYPSEESSTAVVVFKESDELFTLYGCDPDDKRWYCKHVYLVDEQVDQTRIEDYQPDSLNDVQAVGRLAQGESAILVYQNADAKKVQAVLRGNGGYEVFVLEK
ncbi:MAG TPA: ribosome-associated translation inhibitor RaiA, partial [Spirochaetota bacterium]|nr:ribosome-associated translation inhibitor RaiA [Spirochaetota bacterium]